MTPQEQLIEKYKKLGIPMPIPQNEINEAAAASSAHVGSPNVMSKLEMIKKGALKKDFQKIIQKTESGVSSNTNSFQEIPVRKPGQKQHSDAPPLESFSPSGGGGYSQAQEAERIMFGESHQAPRQVPQIQPQQTQNNTEIEEVYGPGETIDYKSKLEKRLNTILPARQHENPDIISEKSTLNNTLFMKKITELEARMQDMVIDVSEQIAIKLINEMTTEIASDVAKKTAIETTKKIILEFGKNGKTILIESDKVKKAEIVAADKVKINGKIYKLTEVKS